MWTTDSNGNRWREYYVLGTTLWHIDHRHCWDQFNPVPLANLAEIFEEILFFWDDISREREKVQLKGIVHYVK